MVFGGIVAVRRLNLYQTDTRDRVILRPSNGGSMAGTQEDGIALPVNCDERRPVITAELVMHRKTARGLSPQQPPLRSVGAMGLLHTVILAKFGSIRFSGYPACHKKGTSSPSPLSP